MAEGALGALAVADLVGAGLTAAEIGGMGFGAAELAAAAPLMGAAAGAGGATAAGLSGFPALGAELAVPEMSWMERLTANPMSALREVVPSKDTLSTVRDAGMIGALGKSLLTPSPPRPLSPVPALSSGSTRGYQPTTNAPIQMLANAIAARRQASAQRRLA